MYAVYGVKQDYEKFVASQLCIGIDEGAFIGETLQIVLFAIIFTFLFAAFTLILRKHLKEGKEEGYPLVPLGEVNLNKEEEKQPTSRELIDTETEEKDAESAHSSWKHETNRIWRNKEGIKKEDSSIEFDEFNFSS